MAEDSRVNVGSFVCSGVRIDDLGPEEAVTLLRRSRYGVARRVHLCNAYTLSLAVRDANYRRMLNESDLNFADGHYVALVGRLRGQAAMRARVYGPDLMLNTMDRGRAERLRHYLYGATPETVIRLAERLRERFPGVEIVSVESPPFRPLDLAEEKELLERVEAVRPDIFWVGLGTPRQDLFVATYAERLGCTVVPVGAAFDFHAGTKRIAPKIVQRMGLEWLFRLLTEPIRLWRRYLFGIPIFLMGVIADHFWKWRHSTGEAANGASGCARRGADQGRLMP
ncbi:MAG: WecB/TagA/CpsF family glycosyltransferase [Micromonosporaceae bacterium]